MSTPLHTAKETLGERVRRFRTEREMSQEKLAELCGFTNGWISKLEKDKYWPSPELITKLAAAFKIPVHELLQEEDKRMELVSRIKLVEVLLERNQSSEAERYIVDLESHPELTQKDKMTLAVHLAECRYQQKRYSDSLELLQPLIQDLESKNHHDAHFMAWIRNLIGSCYFQGQDYTNAHYNYRKAYDLTQRFGEFDILSAKVCYNVALALLKFEFVQESLFFLEFSSSFYRKCNNLKRLSDTFFAQGLAYQHLKMYDAAVESFGQAKTIMLALNLQSSSVIVEHTIASEILAHTDPHLALAKLDECLLSLQENKDWRRVALIYSKKARIFLEQDNVQLAVQQLETALSVIEENKLYESAEAAVTYQVQARCYFIQERFDEAIEYALKSSQIFDTMGLVKDQVHSLQIGAESYQKTGDLQNAFNLSQECNKLLLANPRGSVSP